MQQMAYVNSSNTGSKSKVLSFAGIQPPEFKATTTKSKKKFVMNDLSEDDEFEPEYHTLKKLKMPINRRRLNRGNWSLQENKIYLRFLITNRQSFATETMRREERVFCRLSELLNKKRTPDQCRSHHQKLLVPLKNSLDDLIKKMQRKIASKQIKLPNLIPDFENKMFRLKEQSQQKVGPTDHNSKPVLQVSHSDQQNQTNREVQKSIEGDFYRVTTFKNNGTILLEIDEISLKTY